MSGALLADPLSVLGPSGPLCLRVVSYNVCGFGAGFRDLDPAEVTKVYGKLRSDLVSLSADILCLNEVKRMKLQDPEGNRREDTLEALAEDLDMEYFFAHANPGYESFGNAIMVRRLQVIHCDSAHLEGGSSIGAKHIGRGCLAVPRRRLFFFLLSGWC